MRIQYIKLELVYQLSKTLLSYCMVVKQKKINTHIQTKQTRNGFHTYTHKSSKAESDLLLLILQNTVIVCYSERKKNNNNILNKAKHRYRYVSVVVINKSLIIIVQIVAKANQTTQLLSKFPDLFVDIRASGTVRNTIIGKRHALSKATAASSQQRHSDPPPASVSASEQSVFLGLFCKTIENKKIHTKVNLIS